MARRLLILNGLAILGVILNHSIAQGFVAMFWWTDRFLPVTVPNFDQLGSPAYYVLRLIEQLVAYSVPSFLFVSGFFIAFVARGTISEGWKIALKRAVALVIPYLIWSIVTLSVYFLQGNVYTPLVYINALLFGRAAAHFYFIPLLVQLYLLSPLLVWLAKKNWKLILILSASIQLIAQSGNYLQILGVNPSWLAVLQDITPNWLFINKIFWFVLGIVVSLNLQHFSTGLSRAKWILAILWIMLLFVGLYEWEILLRYSGKEWIPYFDSIVDSFYALVFILAYLAFDKLRVPVSKKVSELGTRSYGIYLTHSLAIVYTSKIIYHAAPNILGYQIILQPILIAAGLGIPLLLMYLVERSPLSRFYGYLFG